MRKKRIWTVGTVILVLLALLAGFFITLKKETSAREISVGEAEQFVNEKLDGLAQTNAMRYIAEQNRVTVNAVSYGDEKDIILDCTYDTLDVRGALSPQYDFFMQAEEKKKNGTMFKSALDFKLEFEPEILRLLESADKKTENGTIYIYDGKEGLILYTEKAVINSAYGGILDVRQDIEEKETVVRTDETGKTEETAITSSNLKKGFLQCFETNISTEKPDISTGLLAAWNKTKSDFNRNFIEVGRWKTIFTGLWITIKLTIFALIMGIAVGFLVAFVRCTYLKTTKHGILLKIGNGIAQTYLTVVRGTPVVVQIMIIYFVIFMPLGIDKFLSAVICFGLNSGAYVAEIVRGGIMSIDNGQTEAGRSLGLSYMQTMWYIVFPQAFKAVLPALANEFVVLLKETSIAFYIGLGDLMYAGNAIRAATYSAFMPLIAVAIIYLVMVLALSHLVSLLERRLRNSER